MITTLKDIEAGIRQAQTYCHGQAFDMGWWLNQDTSDINVVLSKIALAHSELSEALEGARKDLMDDHLPHRKMLEVELADAVIRILDLGGALGLDIGAAMADKLAYNRTRPDHKLENRAKPGGKKA